MRGLQRRDLLRVQGRRQVRLRRGGRLRRRPPGVQAGLRYSKIRRRRVFQAFIHYDYYCTRYTHDYIICPGGLHRPHGQGAGEVQRQGPHRAGDRAGLPAEPLHEHGRPPVRQRGRSSTIRKCILSTYIIYSILYNILYYVTLYYIILCYIILSYIILCYVMRPRRRRTRRAWPTR